MGEALHPPLPNCMGEILATNLLQLISIYMYILISNNDQMVQGYRGVNINSRHNEESLGELYRKDDIDVSNQEHTAPVYFQSLSLD